MQTVVGHKGRCRGSVIRILTCIQVRQNTFQIQDIENFVRTVVATDIQIDAIRR